MSNRPGRKTHSDRLGEDDAQNALRPLRPAKGAINPNRQTSAQREKRSTPTARDRCPVCEAISSTRRTGAQREKDERQTPTAGLSRGRRTGVNSVDSVRAACEGPTSNSASAAFPLGLSPCNRDHAPRFLWSETVVKAKQCNHYYQTVPALNMPWKRYGPHPLI